MVKIIIDGDAHQIDEATKNLMEYIAQVDTIEGSAKEEYDIPNIHKQAFQHLLESCKIAGNNFPQITKVKGNDAKEYIGNDLDGFFGKLSNAELNNLFKASHFLKMKGLQMCISTYFACRIYIPLNLQAYQNKKKQLGVEKQLTTEVSSKYRNKYMFL